MTTDELISQPCIHCGQYRKQHVGQAFACFGGYGTVWTPRTDEKEEESERAKD